MKNYGNLEEREGSLVREQKWKISWENAFLLNRKGCEDTAEVKGESHFKYKEKHMGKDRLSKVHGRNLKPYRSQWLSLYKA